MNGSDKELRELPVSVMAYIGDAVYELAVRKALAARFRGKSGELHRRCVRLVKAAAQADVARRLFTDLTERRNLYSVGGETVLLAVIPSMRHLLIIGSLPVWRPL
jgi:ribonuclease-3 family protein